MLKRIFIIAVLFLFSARIAFCFSEDDIAEIEYSKYGEIYNSESISERLARLENDFFGMSQTGDTDSRIAMLSKMSANSKRSAIINPYDNYYSSKKKNSIKNFWDNISSGFYDDGIMTGFTPSIASSDFYNEYYTNGGGFFNNTNNRNSYNPYYGNNNGFFNRIFRNSNNNLYKNAYNRPIPQYNRRITPPNPHMPYNPYRNGTQRSYYQVPPSIATKSSVHILQD